MTLMPEVQYPEPKEVKMPERRGLLFDLDGTIADTLPHIFRSFRHAVEPWVSRPPTEAEKVATFGPPERDCIAQMLTHPELAWPGSIAHLDTADRRFHTYYQENHAAATVFPGIRETFAFARSRGWNIAVFTGKGRRSAQFTLDDLELSQHVNHLVGGDDVAKGKPDPEGVIQTLDRLDLTPAALLVIGDSPLDILAARAAGVKNAAALWGAHEPEATLAAGPSWSLASSTQLLPFLCEWAGKSL
jgi:HAD superfamily hydrolase (TIGR01509 family)